MNRILLFALILAFVQIPYSLFSQSARRFTKSGEEMLESKNYTEAINHFTKAIEIDPEYDDAYVGRAKALEKTGKYREAAEDYKRATVFDPNEYEYYYHSGRLFNKVGMYKKAIEMLDKSIAEKDNRRNVGAFQEKAKACVALEKYDDAYRASKIALDLDDTPFNLFYYGYVCKLNKNLPEAERALKAAIEQKNDYERAYIELADVQRQLEMYEQGIASATKAINLNAKSKDAYMVRSQIYREKLDYPSAINDLSRVTVLDPDNENVFYQRGLYYQEFNNHINAISDFSKVIALNDTNYLALAKRAFSYEQVTDFKNAIKDYEKIISLKANTPLVKKLINDAEHRLFELKREETPPTFKILDPAPKEEGIVEAPGNAEKIKVQVRIVDENDIKEFYLNDKKVYTPKDTALNAYQLTIDISEKDSFKLAATDVYDNTGDKVFKIKHTETGKPVIELISPYASDNGEIYLSSYEPNLFVSGKIRDESLIETITVNSVRASYVPEDNNPSFTAQININNINKMVIRVIDIYGNETIQEYRFNRSDADLLESNPMGKTWVVFIENSAYKNFASLEGPKKDVLLMKAALAQYRIHNVIHKKNLSKQQLERFFSITLRDMVRNNRVNSLLIWYAGHGKFINETGYWIPVDARRDDEFSYFNVANLRSYLSSYNNVTHTLLITDACESGPSFFQAMRNELTERSCNDATATKFKSSQVFTSAGYELAIDDSQFTRTFANSLNYNTNSCMPIESIVIKVKRAVSQSRNQTPKFGKIKGLGDENGTFFFMKKE